VSRLNRRTGIVMLPMLFGTSASFIWHILRLRLLGYSVVSVDLYEGKRPFFFPYVAGPKASAAARTELADSIDDTRLEAQISGAAMFLRATGSNRVVLFGFGYGGIAALNNSTEADAVVAWYPHLIAPEGSRKAPPDLGTVTCPALLIFGEDDDETPGSLELALRFERTSLSVSVLGIAHAGHAFADLTVQGGFPSPKYRPKAAFEAWGAIKWWLRCACV